MKLLLRSGPKSPVSKAWIERLAAMVLKRVKGWAFERRAELSVVMAGDGEMRRLNKAFRGKDRTTDVLSFPLLEGERLVFGGKGSLPLGDVVVSLPQAKRQARMRGVPTGDEVALLLVHGILHLLGYDHVTKAQEKRMFGLQEKLLRLFNHEGTKTRRKA